MSYELPPPIRAAIESYALEKIGSSALLAAAEDVSKRYRREGVNGSFQLKGDAEALAYLVARLPATYAANTRVMAEIEKRLPAFAPQTILDVGAGPGTATLAACHTYSSIKSINLVEPNRFLQSVGQAMLSPYFSGDAQWINSSLALQGESWGEGESQYDLILASYVLNETSLDKVHKLVEKLWASCSGVMIILEPGTPQGAEIIGKIREFAVSSENTAILAPCPHTGVCPLADTEGRWCHFAVRTSRTKLHKTLKGGDAGFEDEKFSYIVLSRFSAERTDNYRLIGYPSGTKLRELQVCGSNGAETLQVSKSHPLHKLSKKLDWGDGFDL